MSGIADAESLSKAEHAKLSVLEPVPGDLVPCFTYVRIPANEREPYEEIVAMLPLQENGTVLAGDQIPALVKPKFADRSKGLNHQVLEEHTRSTLGASAAKVTSRHFTEATLDGSVETFALCRPSKENGYRGVYIYLDEVGVIKQLPENPRAAAIAASCGKSERLFVT